MVPRTDWTRGEIAARIDWPAVRICRNEEDRGVHLAVAWGQVDAGRVGFRPEHSPEAGLAGADRAAFGRAGWRDGDRAVGRHEL